MNKFLTKITGASLAIAMMIGVGAGLNVVKQAKEVNAATTAGTATITLGSAAAGRWAVGQGSGTNTNSTANPAWSKPSPDSGSHTFTDVTNSDDANGLKWTATYAYTGAYSITRNGGDTPNVQFGKSSNPPTTLTFVSSALSQTMTLSAFNCKYGGAAGSATIKGSLYVDNTSIAVGNKITGTGTTTVSYTTGTQVVQAGSVLKVVFSDMANGVKVYNFSYTLAAYGGEQTGHTVSFNTNGGSAVSPQNVADNGNAEVPETNPTKRGYKFIGWYTEDQYPNGNQFDFENTPITDDLELLAKWDKADETASYSTALANGDYRISGEVTAITGSSEFFIQKGNSAMKIGGTNEITSSLVTGNGVDLFGTYVSGSSILNSLLYCDPTSDTDETISQTAINDLENVTNANLYKYFEISAIQLNSGFDNSKQATIKNSSLIVFYNAVARVSTNNGAFVYGDYHQNDYIYAKGVINKAGNVLGLYITYIEKMASHVITFNPNYDGGVSTTQNVLANERAQQPSNPSRPSDELYSYTFAGWYTEPECENAYDFDGAVTSSFTLYAKWNRAEIEAKIVIPSISSTQASLSYSNYTKHEGTGGVDTIDVDLTEATGTTYVEWSDKTVDTGVTYAGKNAKGNGVMQLNNNKQKAGIVTTDNETVHVAKKFTVVWDSHTSQGNSISIFGKNTPYASALDLYDEDTRGDCIDTLSYGNEKTSFKITDSYKYIGIVSSGLVYLTSVEIQWGDLTHYEYSDLAIRFGGTISKGLYERLNTESTVLGYGVMLSTKSFLDGDDLKDYYDPALIDQINVKNFSSTGAFPTLVNNTDYVWNLYKTIPVSAEDPEESYKETYVAVAYIKIQGEVIFLDEVEASAKSLAHDLIQSGQYNNESFGGSLNYLANVK